MLRTTLVLAVVLFFLTGCALFQQRPVPIERDPYFVHCTITGLIIWDQGTPERTLRQIKIHNGSRRRLCPTTKYREWSYDDLPDSDAPPAEKIVVTPR